MVLLKSGRTGQHLQADHPAFDGIRLFGNVSVPSIREDAGCRHAAEAA